MWFCTCIMLLLQYNFIPLYSPEVLRSRNHGSDSKTARARAPANTANNIYYYTHTQTNTIHVYKLYYNILEFLFSECRETRLHIKNSRYSSRFHRCFYLSVSLCKSIHYIRTHA